MMNIIGVFSVACAICRRQMILVVAFLCMAAGAIGQTPDPGVMGPHAVLKAEYNLGDLAYAPPPAAMFPANMEVRGSVHYPADIATSGPFPVLIWMHGRHETCYQVSDSTTSSDWPCPTGWQPIVSYEGYDYAARTMASYGYIVISVSANAINAIDGGLSDAGMNARGVLVQHHLDLWNTWNTTGGAPFGTTFVGKLDMQNIGTMGHSRGGEGVVFNAEYNRSLGSPYGIKAVLTLAPVDFSRHVLNGIPLMDIAPYCDGDVSDLQGVHFYDDARYKDLTDETPKHIVLMMGANHDFFNTVWTPGSYIAGGADDWKDYGYDSTDVHCGDTSASRFDTTKQKAAFNAYAAAFYRLYIGRETKFAPLLEVNDIVPPVSSTLDSTNVYVSYHAARSDRFDINRIDTATAVTTNTIGGAVTETGLISPVICGGGISLPTCDAGLGSDQKPHRGTLTKKGLAQMRIRWSDTTNSYENDIPSAYQDFTYYSHLSFRACVNFSETTSGSVDDFSVQLIDSAGAVSSQLVSDHSHAIFHEPGTETFTLPKVIFNTIQLPLSSFTGVDMSKIRHIRFLFNQSMAGAILVTDIGLNNPICGNLTAFYTDSIPATGHKIFFTNKSSVSAGDTVTRLWHFGDPASGVNDTSTAANPFHIYAYPGTYTACLYITVKRKNGFTCTDSFCTSVVQPLRTGIEEVADPVISIVPNPAKDYLLVNGAGKTDILRIVNLYGQEVFSTPITRQRIDLPHDLAAGLYYIIVVSPRGNLYQKLLIAK